MANRSCPVPVFHASVAYTHADTVYYSRGPRPKLPEGFADASELGPRAARKVAINRIPWLSALPSPLYSAHAWQRGPLRDFRSERPAHLTASCLPAATQLAFAPATRRY